MYQRPGQKIPQGFYLVWGECGTANCTQSVYRAPDAQALLDFRLDKVAPDVWKIKDAYGELIQINQLQSDGELLYLHVGDGDPRSEFHAHFMIFDPIKGAVVNESIPTPGMNTIPDGSFGVVKTESLASSSGPSLRAADVKARRATSKRNRCFVYTYSPCTPYSLHYDLDHHLSRLCGLGSRTLARATVGPFDVLFKYILNVE